MMKYLEMEAAAQNLRRSPSWSSDHLQPHSVPCIMSVGVGANASMKLLAMERMATDRFDKTEPALRSTADFHNKI